MAISVQIGHTFRHPALDRTGYECEGSDRGSIRSADIPRADGAIRKSEDQVRNTVAIQIRDIYQANARRWTCQESEAGNGKVPSGSTQIPDAHTAVRKLQGHIGH